MLITGYTYRNNNGRKVTIGGRIKKYSPQTPFVWAIHGDWCHEHTGAFINFRKPTSVLLDGEHVPLSMDNPRCISDHLPIDPETGNRIETDSP